MQRTKSLEKTLMLGKIEGWEEKGTTEDEMVGGHHRHDRHEFERAPGVGDGQGGLACCSPWGSKELDTTETELNWTETLNRCRLNNHTKFTYRPFECIRYISLLIYGPLCVKQLVGGCRISQAELSVVLYDDLKHGMGMGRKAKDGSATCILTADSHCYCSRNQPSLVKLLSYN